MKPSPMETGRMCRVDWTVHGLLGGPFKAKGTAYASSAGNAYRLLLRPLTG